jgi:hypothetical protein
MKLTSIIVTWQRQYGMMGCEEPPFFRIMTIKGTKDLKS